MGYLWIAITILLSVYGQIVLKWRMDQLGPLPDGLRDGAAFLLKALLDVYILSTFVAAFLASLAWMAALTRFEISFAYPFMALSFAMVLVLGWLLLGETLTWNKVAAVVLIMGALWIGTR